MDSTPRIATFSAPASSSEAVTTIASSPSGRISRATPSFIRPLRTSVSSTTRSLDGLQSKFKGVRPIQSSGPTACVRPASLVYRAPMTLHGGASRLLRHILRTSSSSSSPTTVTSSTLAQKKTEYLPNPPVKFLSLPSKKSDFSHKYLNRSDEILGCFLLNNGGYLDDSDSESEDGDESANDHETNLASLANKPVLSNLTK